MNTLCSAEYIFHTHCPLAHCMLILNRRLSTCLRLSADKRGERICCFLSTAASLCTYVRNTIRLILGICVLNCVIIYFFRLPNCMCMIRIILRILGIF